MVAVPNALVVGVNPLEVLEAGALLLLLGQLALDLGCLVAGNHLGPALRHAELLLQRLLDVAGPHAGAHVRHNQRLHLFQVLGGDGLDELSVLLGGCLQVVLKHRIAAEHVDAGRLLQVALGLLERRLNELASDARTGSLNRR